MLRASSSRIALLIERKQIDCVFKGVKKMEKRKSVLIMRKQNKKHTHLEHQNMDKLIAFKFKNKNTLTNCSNN